MAALASPGTPTSRSSRLAGKRILVVDDEDDARDLVRMVLESCQAEVCDSESVDDALAVLADRDVDLIISDIGMPVRDGLALIAAVRADEATADIPAVALTGFNRPQDVLQSLRAGFDAHLTKPSDSKRLLEVVETLLEPRV